MTQIPSTPKTEQTALEAMLDALVAIVAAELPEPAVLIPFLTVL
ncbi:hypothetical protein ACLBX9_07075 [Methylobacterium sp. A49B]